MQHLDDHFAATDSFQFLLKWFQRFPQYKSNDFYIVGESYAGRLVPQLAQKVFEANKQSAVDNFINLKGFIIGNPRLDGKMDQKDIVNYAREHGQLSGKAYAEINKSCNFSLRNMDKVCYDVFNDYLDMNKAITMFSHHQPRCSNDDAKRQRTIGGDVVHPTASGDYRYAWSRSFCPGGQPCVPTLTKGYMNKMEVQEAVHAAPTGIGYNWTHCSDAIHTWRPDNFSVLPIIEKLVQGGLRIWVYSGDADNRIPVAATWLALNKLGLCVKRPWTRWYHGDQTGGWTYSYKGLTFVTILGAGHPVPVFKPAESEQMIRFYLAGKELPATIHK